MLLTLLRERRMLREGGVTSMEVEDSTTVADAVGQWRLANGAPEIARIERRHSVPVPFG